MNNTTSGKRSSTTGAIMGLTVDFAPEEGFVVPLEQGPWVYTHHSNSEVIRVLNQQYSDNFILETISNTLKF